MCNCHSYNGEFGETKEVILKHLVAVLPDGAKEYKDVCIDACIAYIIQELWNNGISTGGSCCGHGKVNPSIVCNDIKSAIKARDILSEIDDRYFEISYWARVVV